MDSEQLRVLRRIGAVKKQLGSALSSEGGNVSGGLDVKDKLTAAGGMAVTGGMKVSGQIRAAGAFSAGNGRLVVPSDGAGTLKLTGAVEAGGRLVVPADSASDITIDGHRIWHTGSMEVEYGTWTPTLYGQTVVGSPVYSTRAGAYARTGNLCVVNYLVTVASKGGMAGRIRIGGLPFIANYGSTDSEQFMSTTGGLVYSGALGLVARSYGGSASFSIMIRRYSSGLVLTYAEDGHLTDGVQFKGTLIYRTEG